MLKKEEVSNILYESHDISCSLPRAGFKVGLEKGKELTVCGVSEFRQASCYIFSTISR